MARISSDEPIIAGCDRAAFPTGQLALVVFEAERAASVTYTLPVFSYIQPLPCLLSQASMIIPPAAPSIYALFHEREMIRQRIYLSGGKLLLSDFFIWY